MQFVSGIDGIQNTFGSEDEWKEALTILFKGLDQDKNEFVQGAEFEHFVKMMKELMELEKQNAQKGNNQKVQE